MCETVENKPQVLLRIIDLTCVVTLGPEQIDEKCVGK